MRSNGRPWERDDPDVRAAAEQGNVAAAMILETAVNNWTDINSENCSTRAWCWPVSLMSISMPCGLRSPRRPRTPTTHPSSDRFAPCREPTSRVATAPLPRGHSHTHAATRAVLLRKRYPRRRARGAAPSASPTTWSWSTGPAGRCATTNAGPSPRIWRRS